MSSLGFGVRGGPSRLVSLCAAVLALACTGEQDASGGAGCAEECQDRVALRGVREILKLVYNLTLQGNAVGAQDETTACPLGGQARVFGEATSDPEHGASDVTLTYELDRCTHLERDEEPGENYGLLIDGTVQQTGVIAVQPSATSALIMTSDSLTVAGYVHDPPIDYAETGCVVTLGQNGSNVSGMFCGREVGLEL
jgi:hypothetical protein